MSAAGPPPVAKAPPPIGMLALVLKAYPTLLRVGFAEAVAYRAEMLVWMLTLTMPLVSMALWSSAAEGTRLGPEQLGSAELVAYFLITLLLRLLTGSWVLWQLSEDIRTGALGQRLLRPVPPLVAYTAEQLAPLPLRAALVLPKALILLATQARAQLTGDPWLVVAFVLALPGAWAINFLSMALIGALAFISIARPGFSTPGWALHAVSGYLMPLSLFPLWLRQVSDLLPFRYMLDAPVKMLLGWPIDGGARDTGLGRWLAYKSLGIEYAYVVVLGLLVMVLWRRGLRRFAAFGRKMATLVGLGQAARRYARLLGLQLRVSLLQGMQYRWDFLTQGLMQVVWLAMAAVPLLVAYKARAAAQGGALTATDIGGWGFYPASIVFGFFCLLKAVLEGAINPSLLAVVEQIRKGTLDFVLLKPADAQFLVSTARFEPWHVIDGLGALVLIGVATQRHHLAVGGAAPGVGAIAGALVLLGCAVLMLYAVWLLVVCAAFYVVRIDNLSYLFSSVFDFARWPRSVFRGALLVVFTYVLPLAVMTSFPADALLGRLRPWQAGWAIGSAAALLFVSRRVWQRAIAGYTSASS